MSALWQEERTHKTQRTLIIYLHKKEEKECCV